MKKYLIALMYVWFALLGIISYGQTIGTKLNTPFNTTRTFSILSDDRIFAGTLNEGLYYSPDKGSTWIYLTFPQTQTGTACKLSNGDLYVDANNYGLYLNKNENGTWNFVGFTDVGIDQIFESASGYLIAHVSSYNPAVYSSVYTFYLSKDNGLTWKYIPSQFEESLALCIAKHPNGDIYIATSQGVFKSSTGESWTYCHPGYIESLAIRSDGTIYIGLENELRTSTDEGATWKVLTFTQSPFEITKILRDTRDNMYIETSNISTSFLYKNNNGSSTWDLLGELNGHNGHAFASKMQINSRGDIFYMDGSSLYKVNSTITSTENNVNTYIPQKFQLYQNYPNPFNPNTLIRYQLPEDGLVTLKVYDVLGKEIATLVNDHQSAGYYKVEFKASNLSSGLYIYKITAKNFTQSRKMLFMK
jgi:hypothetical protein